MAPSLDEFPKTFCKNKILPQLLNAFEYGDAGSHILAPLFKVGIYMYNASMNLSLMLDCFLELLLSGYLDDGECGIYLLWFISCWLWAPAEFISQYSI